MAQTSIRRLAQSVGVIVPVAPEATTRAGWATDRDVTELDNAPTTERGSRLPFGDIGPALVARLVISFASNRSLAVQRRHRNAKAKRLALLEAKLRERW